MRVIVYQAQRHICPDARTSARKDFKCPCGCGTRQMVDSELVEKLQRHPGCSSGKAIKVTSGYRCHHAQCQQNRWRKPKLPSHRYGMAADWRHGEPQHQSCGLWASSPRQSVSRRHGHLLVRREYASAMPIRAVTKATWLCDAKKHYPSARPT